MAKTYPPLNVPSWGVAIMFAAFLVFTLIWEKLTHALKHYLKHHNKIGLLEVLHKIEEELLAMGLISLLLPFFEGYIMLICVPSLLAQQAPGYNHKGWASDLPDTYSKNSYPSNYSSRSSYPAAASSPDTQNSSYSGRRHLLAAASPSADYAKDETCDPGMTKLYPVEAIHGIHIFIALTAIVHILYACVSMAICLWRVSRWRHWEAQAVSDMPQMIVMTPAMMKGIGRNSWRHGLFCLVNQFVLPVNQEMYLGLRRLLLEALKTRGGLTELPVEFPYFAFIKEQMELSFCRVIGVSPFIWFFALIQLVVPVTFRVWSVIAVCIACIILQVITGAKLYSVATHLAARAHLEHGVESIEAVARHILPKRTTTWHGIIASRRITRQAKQQQQQQQQIKEEEAAARHPGDDLLSAVDSYDAEAAAHFGAAPATAAVRHGKPDDSGAKSGAGHGLLQGLWAAAGTGEAASGGIRGAAGSAPRLQDLDKQHQANVVRRYKTFAGRVVSAGQLSELFWCQQPYLLLWINKLAYFQSAFCLTLMFFAVWKDNQFLPDKGQTSQIVAFAVVLTVNVVLSLCQSAIVAPIYALVTHTADDKAVSDACKFLERQKKHEEQQQVEAAPQPAAAQAHEDVETVRHVLQKLHSTANRMAATAAAAGSLSTLKQDSLKDVEAPAHGGNDLAWQPPQPQQGGSFGQAPAAGSGKLQPVTGTGAAAAAAAAAGDGGFEPLRRTAGAASGGLQQPPQQQQDPVLRPCDTWTPQDQAAAAAAGGGDGLGAGSGVAPHFFDQPGARQTTLGRNSWTRD